MTLADPPAVQQLSREEQREMHDAIEFHIEDLRLAGEPIPEPRSQAAYRETAA